MTETLPCGNARFPHHAGLCAYHGDGGDRCPTCHSLWAAITQPKQPTGSHRSLRTALAAPDPNQAPDRGPQAPTAALSGEPVQCAGCLQTWPCEVEQLRRRLAEAEARNRGMQ